MSQEARDQLCQENKKSKGRQRGGRRDRSSRGSAVQEQQRIANDQPGRGRSQHSRGIRFSVVQFWNCWRTVHNVQTRTWGNWDSYYLWWPSDLFYDSKPINRSEDNTEFCVSPKVESSPTGDSQKQNLPLLTRRLAPLGGRLADDSHHLHDSSHFQPVWVKAFANFYSAFVSGLILPVSW